MLRRYLVMPVVAIRANIDIPPPGDTKLKPGYVVLDTQLPGQKMGELIRFLQFAFWHFDGIYFCSSLDWVQPRIEDVIPNFDIGVILRHIFSSSSGFSAAAKDLYEFLQ